MVGASRWDIGPGSVFIEDLGGSVTGCRGEQYEYHTEHEHDQKIEAGVFAINSKLAADTYFLPKFKDYFKSVGLETGIIPKTPKPEQ
jgi:3'-phosphoadenosine 5'-phosphosulfate (PAPS) 3'-phosphatase